MGRWTEPAILPELPPPPADRIQVRGAQRLRIYNIDDPDHRKRAGYREAVAVAWARLPGGDWAALIGWMGYWREPNGRATGKARHAWVRVLPDRTRAMPLRPQRDPEREWHGQHRDSEFAQAVRDAVATLSAELRERAAAPYEPGPDGA